ncbi:MAG: glycoside hydrolase family 127 protein [Candidatus Marsarchaeota archaeon]
MAYSWMNSKSPFAKARTVPVDSVTLKDDFWRPRLEDLRSVTLPSQLTKLEETGHLHNFRRAAGLEGGSFEGLVFNDSDVYKWVEATALSSAYWGDKEMFRLIGPVASLIESAQDEDGYINTYFTLDKKQDRWRNLRDNHELYCAGHLIQAAIAYHRAANRLGNPEEGGRLLGVALRLADHVVKTFGHNPGQTEGVPGHPEIEMALVELYRETGKPEYLHQAEYFIDARGKGLIGGSPYHLDHIPLREMNEITGHAVRALYLLSGAADVFMETGDAALLAALERLWEDLQRKTYVTGGVGSRREGESIGEEYELPNARAYAETCAAVANVMFNHRMFLITGDSKYVDAAELALYNAALAGISLDGTHYFYANPLADSGKTRRQGWFECACCPTNIIRLLSYLPSLLYATSDGLIWVNMYAKSEATVTVSGVEAEMGKADVRIIQDTDYPWDGRVKLRVKLASPTAFELRLRVPAWAGKAEITWPGGKAVALPGNFFSIRRTWRDDAVSIRMPIRVRLLTAHPRVAEDTCRVAIARGPLIYCVETAGNRFDPRDLAVPDRQPFHQIKQRISGKMITSVVGGGFLLESPANTYAELGKAIKAAKTRVKFEAVPYYAWGNREPGPMAVWLLRSKYFP